MKVTESIAVDHGLKKEEFEKICKLLERIPNFTELGIFSAMWNEHCSYKSSRKHLKKLHTKGKKVIQGPGENAGVIDIEDNDAIVSVTFIISCFLKDFQKKVIHLLQKDIYLSFFQDEASFPKHFFFR